LTGALADGLADGLAEDGLADGVAVALGDALGSLRLARSARPAIAARSAMSALDGACTLVAAAFTAPWLWVTAALEATAMSVTAAAAPTVARTANRRLRAALRNRDRVRPNRESASSVVLLPAGSPSVLAFCTGVNLRRRSTHEAPMLVREAIRGVTGDGSATEIPAGGGEIRPGIVR
jgi:hypothetical protein